MSLHLDIYVCVDATARYEESGSEIFWGLYWGPHFDGDYQTNQI
jgi:hypothetical protein